jgi:hypothetical protein
MKNQSSAEQELAAEVIRRFRQLAGDRHNWENHWEEIAERIQPESKGLFQSDFRTKGEKRTEEIFDSTAQLALGRFASILDSLLTPRNQMWHRLAALDPKLAKRRDVKLWFEEVNAILFRYRYATAANFSAQNNMNYESLGAYGSGCMFIDDLDSPLGGIRYKHCHLGSVFFSENHQGMIDTVYRRFPFTAKQAVDKWGEDRLPDAIVECLKSNPNKEFYFVHCVQPNPNPDPTRLDFLGMKYQSLYIAEQGNHLVSQGGYETFPYAPSRYKQSSGEIYGRSPAMDVLPAVKTLNEEKKTLLKQGHRAVDPVLLVHDDGVIDNFSLRPGALNAGGMSPEGRPLVGTLPVGNVAIGKDMMDDERQLINDSFLISLFQILLDTPQMTATEVLERTKEKGILLAPTIGRQESEYLGPLIDRELDVLARQEKLPPMPRVLEEAQAEFKTEFDSPLSRTQRAQEAAGLFRSVEQTLNIVNVTQDPAPLDHYDWDVIIPEVNDINGVPERWRRDPQAVQSIRESRAQAQQINQAAEVAPGAAALINAGTKARG